MGWALTALAFLSVGGVVGALVVLSGIVPIKASSGHWAITAWFLDFAKGRSVATHTLGTTVPRLDQDGLKLKGATHYHAACRPCHGGPTLEQPSIAKHMTPRPPDLRESVRTLEPAELFYIVKHGIKLTGMPAWPALARDDEVWAMVAFLRVLPGLQPAEYDRLAGLVKVSSGEQVPLEDLVGQSPRAAETVQENCARCHGIDGRGRGAGAFPRLAGQRAAYLSATLGAYARGERHSGIMEPVAASLDAQDRALIAEFYAGLPAGGADAWETSAEIERGRQIASVGVPERLVPPCQECHGPRVTRNPHYPRLAGQYADYLRLQLSLFRRQARGGTPYHTIMHKIAGQLTEEQVRAVTAYYAALPGER
jgi:cytochrome c553